MLVGLTLLIAGCTPFLEALSRLAPPGFVPRDLSGAVPEDLGSTGKLEYTGRAVVHTSATADLLVFCDPPSTHYALQTERPSSLASAEWLDCPGAPGAIVTTPPLSDGENEFKLWFRSVVGLNPTPQTIIVHKEPSRFFHLTGTELGTLNASSRTPIILNDHLWLIADPLNDVAGVDAGALHIATRRGDIVHTIRGRCAGDEFSSLQVLRLDDSRFVVVSPKAANADCSISRVGQVVVFHKTGAELARWQGSVANDRVGSCGSFDFLTGVKVLANSNLSICSTHEDADGLVDSGRYRLIRGSDYQTLLDIKGDVAGDKIGLSAEGVSSTSGIVELDNGNLVVSSIDDSIASGDAQVGSFHLINSVTGVIIHSAFGDAAGDSLGRSIDGILKLQGGQFLISSSLFSTGAGKLEVRNPSTGLVISQVVGALATGINLGLEGHQVFPNGNLLFNAFAGDRGLAVVVNNTTGAMTSVSGPDPGDQWGVPVIFPAAVTLTNGNFVLLSTYDDSGGLIWTGSATLVNGTTGAVILTITGAATLEFSNAYVQPLENGNFFLVQSSFNGNRGRIRLISGSDGTTLWNLAFPTFADLASTNFEFADDDVVAVSTPYENFGGLSNNGCIRLLNTSTGTIISSTCGAAANDYLGSTTFNSPELRIIDSPILVVPSPQEADAGIAKGSIRIYDSVTGALLRTISGDAANDLVSAKFVSISETVSLIGLPNYDVGGLVDAGRLLVISNSDGSTIQTIDGLTAGEQLGLDLPSFFNLTRYHTTENEFLVTSFKRSTNGLTENGSIFLINRTSGAISGTIHGPTNASRVSTAFFENLSNGDFLFSLSNATVSGISSAGAYLLVPNQ